VSLLLIFKIMTHKKGINRSSVWGFVKGATLSCLLLLSFVLLFTLAGVALGYISPSDASLSSQLVRYILQM
jgi:hypothetical protein